MLTRSAPTDTIETLMDSLDQTSEALSVPSSEIKVRREQGTITIGTRETPITEPALDVIAGWVDFPRPFLRRLDPDLRDPLLTTMLERKATNVVAKVGNSGLLSLKEPNALDIDPRRIVEVASHVLTPQAQVVEWDNRGGEFYFDTFIDVQGFGAPEVNDVTFGGLRFRQDTFQNLAPSVAPYLYRLVCTNGMQTRKEGQKLDARGQSVDEVIAQLEAAAQIAFARVESDVAHFYELRNEHVTHPERVVARLAAEHNVSDRLRLQLIEAVPTVVDANGGATMFDLVNLFTNIANTPGMRRGSRLALEQFGGSVVSTHIERCQTCASKLN